MKSNMKKFTSWKIICNIFIIIKKNYNSSLKKSYSERNIAILIPNKNDTAILLADEKRTGFFPVFFLKCDNVRCLKQMVC